MPPISHHAAFLAELGPPLGDADLEVLLVRARTADEPELRALVKQHLALRRVTEWLVADVAAHQGRAAMEAVHPMLELARFLTESSNPLPDAAPGGSSTGAPADG